MIIGVFIFLIIITAIGFANMVKKDKERREIRENKCKDTDSEATLSSD
jgi:hypothetical protein